MPVVYKYRLQGMFKTPPEVAGSVCQELSESAEGLTPKRLVDVSRPDEAPLHEEFEWDDAVAGEKYRETQANNIIRSIVVVESDIETERNLKLNLVDEEEPAKDRGFVSTGENTHHYVPLHIAMTNDVWRKNLLESAKRDMRAFTIKYNRLEELAGIIDEMNDFIGA